ncbi:MAG: 2,3,4,5-tetrahydropyridine-2,6-dicarboxylate N-acetyltransferase [Ignavibacteria bacterium]|nr:2,3,4,5-tetrahydropyridine-2,6-dicarboxylate N-acetyltransferase [Ignavibacteria bacterium]
MDSYEIINFIAQSSKKTPVKVYLRGLFQDFLFEGMEYYGNDKFGILFCEAEEFMDFLSKNEDKIRNYRVEADRRNSAVPMADLTKYNARIEPGAIIRDKVEIGDNCVIMMGAVINIGAVIGEKTMIDMNTVIGGRAIVGKECHIGAGTVIAGVIEPPSAEPVVIGDNVVIGANAVVLEGVKVGNGSVIAAGAIVVSDVPENVVVAGMPARVIKTVDDKTKSKTLLIDSLRSL